MAAPVIALLTDFGLADTYAGEIKGAVLIVTPDATIVDITHHVPPQDVNAGAFLLGSAADAFPSGTVFVAVVDPGVGSDRRPLLVETPRAAFVGPDNGLFTRVVWLDGADGLSAPALSAVPPGVRACRLSNPAYWRERVSNTFHGRDVFAPAAAHYASGVPAEALGEPVDALWRLPIRQPGVKDGVLSGEVVYVDHYGNLVTNIPAGMLQPGAVVEVAGKQIEGVSNHYDASRPLVAIVGSHDTLEVAKPGGSAAEVLGVGRGEQVRVSDG